MKREFGRKLRRFILDNTTIHSLHDFQHTQVFRDVLNYTCIPFLIKDSVHANHAIAFTEGSLEQISRHYEQSKLDDAPWIFRFGADEALVERIKADSGFVTLADPLVSSGVSEGIVTGCNSVLLIAYNDVLARGLELDYLRKCIRGEDVKQYSVNWSGYYVVYPYEKGPNGLARVVEAEVLQRKCPALYGYLLESKQKLMARKYMEGTSKRWYEPWCPRDMGDQASTKIVVPELADRNQFALVDSDYYYVDSTPQLTLGSCWAS